MDRTARTAPAVLLGLLVSASWACSQDVATTAATERIAFVSKRDGEREIYVMDADGRHQARVTHNDCDEYSPAWSPDGTKIAYGRSCNGGSDSISVLDLATGHEQVLTSPPGDDDDEGPTWSPDGTRIVFTRQIMEGERTIVGREAWVMNADGTGQMKLGGDEVTDGMYPCWSPDGSRIALAAEIDDAYGLDVINADGRELLRLDSGIVYPDSGPAWSPDGRKIVFSTQRRLDEVFAAARVDALTRLVITSHFNEIWVINSNGTGLKSLVSLEDSVGNKGEWAPIQTSNLWPIWSPDGSKIAFLSSRNCDMDRKRAVYEVFVMDADGGSESQLSSHAVSKWEGKAWSPDGSKIAFASFDKIWVVNSDGSREPTCLAEDGQHPAWWGPPADAPAPPH